MVAHVNGEKRVDKPNLVDSQLALVKKLHWLHELDLKIARRATTAISRVNEAEDRRHLQMTTLRNDWAKLLVQQTRRPTYEKLKELVSRQPDVVSPKVIKLKALIKKHG